MTERQVVVTSDAGVHARPAMMLVRQAMRFKSDISLVKDGVEADCKSIMSVIGLAITAGSVVTVRADGSDEEDAVRCLASMIENDFKADESLPEKN